MPTYISLLNWTDQGVKNAQDTLERTSSNRAALERMGITLLSVYWTQGTYDLVATFDAPDDQTVSAALLSLARGGFVRSTTMRAFNEQEMRQVLQKMG